ALATEQLVRAMLADIVEGAEGALAIPDDGDRLSGDLDGDEGVRLAQLLGVADPLPCLRDDFLQGDLIPARVRGGVGAEGQRPARVGVVSAADGGELLLAGVWAHCLPSGSAAASAAEICARGWSYPQ